MVSSLASAFLAPYLLRPLILLVVLGVVGGVVGAMVNLRSMEFSAEAVVHSVFPGVVGGSLYAGLDGIVPGAAIAAVGVVLALTLARGHRRGAGLDQASESKAEAGTAVVLTGAYAFGMVWSLRKGDMSGQLEALMFGRLLEVTDERLAQALIACAAGFILAAATWKWQVAVGFDRSQFRSTFLIDLAANAAIAAVVVAGSAAIGVLLVIGYLVVPGAAARLLAERQSTMVAAAVGVGLVGGLAGFGLMLVDSPNPISPQAAVALALVAMYGLALVKP